MLHNFTFVKFSDSWSYFFLARFCCTIVLTYVTRYITNHTVCVPWVKVWCLVTFAILIVDETKYLLHLNHRYNHRKPIQLIALSVPKRREWSLQMSWPLPSCTFKFFLLFAILQMLIRQPEGGPTTQIFRLLIVFAIWVTKATSVFKANCYSQLPTRKWSL